MELRAILPVILPGAIMQIFIQAFYIKHCWENPRLSQQQKLRYILFIAIFNIPAAAIYLFLTRTRDEIGAKDFKDVEDDGSIRQGIFALLISAFEIFSMAIMTENLKSPHYSLIIGLLASCFILLIVNGLLVKKQSSLLYYLFPALQILLIMPVVYLDETKNAPFIVLVVVAAVINGFSLNLSKIYSIAAFISYTAIIITKVFQRYGTIQSDEAMSYMFVNILVFLLVYSIFYTLKKQLFTNERLNAALKALKEQSLQLEALSAVAERNRITGEIHDTVGHTLTSALISIEAAEKFLGENTDTVYQKLTLAKEQVKRGLNDIRNSVRTIQTGSKRAFIPELRELLGEISQNTGLVINDIVEIKTDLLPIQQKVLLMAVKECATNSLKHGKSTEADLLLQEYKGTIRLNFSDNGKGIDKFSFGFGLSNMAERIESIGGTLTFDSKEGEGFTVGISIPTGTLKGGEPT